jgi:hypothetical protein
MALPKPTFGPAANLADDSTGPAKDDTAKDDIEIGLDIRNIAHLISSDPHATSAAKDAGDRADDEFVKAALDSKK